MTNKVSRRVFLTATATLVAGLVACRELPPNPPVVSGPPTSTPTSLPPGAPTPTLLPIGVPTPTRMPLPQVASTADGYVAVAPRVLREGQIESVSLSLFRGEQPGSGDVAVALLKDGKAVLDVSGRIAGRGSLDLNLAGIIPGSYELRVSGKGFENQTAIQVEDGRLLFVETDKPIYKPGQTAHIRVLGLDSALRPTSGEAVVEVMDAKGIKVFKKTVVIDDYGMAMLDLPLSSEPNLGVWKVLASTDKRAAEVDMRVERYVLPKYEISVETPKSWALVSEPITGTISAEYSFGKPVAGELEISAMRYVGAWEEYARVTKPIDGKVTFELPAVQYAAGSPADGGQASVRLDVVVREQSTGYQERTSRLVTIAEQPVILRVIPESQSFKPGLPLGLLVVAETPDQTPVDADVELQISYQGASFEQLRAETMQVRARNGLAIVEVSPPSDAITVGISASAANAAGPAVTVRAGYSPSGNFIHVEQVTQGPLKAGDSAQFRVRSTREARNFYYEVLARGKVVFSDVTQTPDITLVLTPQMTPEVRLLVYQLLPNAEVAADWLPFKVAGDYPQRVEVRFDRDEARPGDELELVVQTEGAARIGLAAVDRSVFILAENRLNLQQVFDELERLYLQPQAELHTDPFVFDPFSPIVTPGAKETFQEAGVVVLSNRQVPEGKSYEPRMMVMEAAAGAGPMAATSAPAAAAGADKATSNGQAEVQRVRQFFPETWIWSDSTSDASGRATQRVTAPDSITTWMVRAVALSKEAGLGIAETELRVFQPFFVSVDLPYSAIRGEEFPARVALYNYTPATEEWTVELEAAPWFDLLDTPSKQVTVAANSVGSVEFMIRPTALGVNPLKVTARSASAADAIIKDLIVEPEGVQREVVENLVLAPGAARTVRLDVPPDAIAGSARAYLSLTGNVLSQTIDGLEGLLQMPFGCGEQNMILFAPNVFVTRYLQETNQIKPEIMAKAEKLMLTGYQRELTYRRDDASFSAFGQSDDEGSLWLTAFVLKTFAQARDLIFIDETVLDTAGDWITGHQQADGSFDPVGFVHHQELLGGLQGKTALTAYVAVALHEAGDDAGAAKAVRYLEARLDETADAYGLALVTYALALAQSPRAQDAQRKLMGIARESDEGLSWGDEGVRPLPIEGAPIAADDLMPPQSSAAIETTGYATLALLALGDNFNAGRATRWLASRRNAFGGFGSTQDTIVALQAMTTAAGAGRADLDATITLSAGAWRKEVRVTPENADVLQIVETTAGESLTIDTQGKGQITAQSVLRFNVPEAATPEQPIFKIDVQYDVDQVEVNDVITVTATVTFTPPRPLPATTEEPAIRAGMVVLDIAIPTGFEPVSESVDALVKGNPKLKRWDLAGRKVILYLEDMAPDEQLVFAFQARALYPVKAQPVASQAYSYYRPEWKGESLGRQVVVSA